MRVDSAFTEAVREYVPAAEHTIGQSIQVFRLKQPFPRIEGEEAGFILTYPEIAEYSPDEWTSIWYTELGETICQLTIGQSQHNGPHLWLRIWQHDHWVTLHSHSRGNVNDYDDCSIARRLIAYRLESYLVASVL